MHNRKTANLTSWFFSIIYRHTEGFLMAILTFLLVLDVLLGILARYIHFNVVFATELGKYIFIWLCAIGISAAARDNQHVRIYFIAKRLPVNPRVTWIITQVLFLIFTAFFFFWSLQLTWMHYIMDKEAMGFRFPMYPFTAALPVGFALTSIRLIQNIRGVLKDPTKTPAWDTPVEEEISEITDEFLEGKGFQSKKSS